jgi:hypothetical protein
MVDFTSTMLRPRRWLPQPALSVGGGEVKAAVAKSLSASTPFTTNGVDKMYHQLVEIHAIATMPIW